MATTQTNADSRHDEHHQRCRFGDGGIRTSARADAGRFAEVGPPCVVALLRAVGLAPDDVIGGVDGAVAGEVAGQVRRGSEGYFAGGIEVGEVPRVPDATPIR